LSDRRKVEKKIFQGISMEKRELKELLIKCWMSHDAMWFYTCLQEFGIEKANELNLASIRSLSKIEVPRILRALGINKEKVTTFEELKASIDGLFGILKGNFMGFEYSFPEDHCMRWVVLRCFAYEGMKRMGVIDRYQCGLLHRVACWSEVLGVECTVTPQVESCLMVKDGKCSGEVKFFLPKKESS
jgi:hypothetical protein